MSEASASDAAQASGSVEDQLRLAVLKSTALLDSGPEESFDRFTRLAAKLLSAPVSLVSLVDSDRQYFKSHFGLQDPWASRRETPLSHSFCQYVVDRREPLIVNDAREHPLVCDNLAIPELNVAAYLGVPLVSRENQVLGSFCAIDSQPRVWTEEQVVLMQELAASVMTEVELRRLASRFADNFHALMALGQERDEMIQMLVHDLRNPLSSLLAGLDMLEMSEGLNERHHKYLLRARDGGQGLLTMINEMLAVSRADAGRLDPGHEPVEPARLIRSAIDKVAELAFASGVRLDDQVPAPLSPVHADGARLERVLVNLISNAIDHTPRGGSVQVSAVDISADGVGEFSVQDTGSGIPPAEQSRVFEKFHQAGEADQRRLDRSGLGLPFCKAVVESHGGCIRVDSERGEGARFLFTIPYGR